MFVNLIVNLGDLVLSNKIFDQCEINTEKRVNCWIEVDINNSRQKTSFDDDGNQSYRTPQIFNHELFTVLFVLSNIIYALPIVFTIPLGILIRKLLKKVGVEGWQYASRKIC